VLPSPKDARGADGRERIFVLLALESLLVGTLTLVALLLERTLAASPDDVSPLLAVVLSSAAASEAGRGACCHPAPPLTPARRRAAIKWACTLPSNSSLG
jgi:hypothetical protein